jgi:hypothetical protein
MGDPLTPKPTRKTEALAQAPPTIVSRHKEDVALKEVAKPRLCCVNGLFETKSKDGSTERSLFIINGESESYMQN